MLNFYISYKSYISILHLNLVLGCIGVQISSFGNQMNYTCTYKKIMMYDSEGRLSTKLTCGLPLGIEENSNRFIVGSIFFALFFFLLP